MLSVTYDMTLKVYLIVDSQVRRKLKNIEVTPKK